MTNFFNFFESNSWENTCRNSLWNIPRSSLNSSLLKSLDKKINVNDVEPLRFVTGHIKNEIPNHLDTDHKSHFDSPLKSLLSLFKKVKKVRNYRENLDNFAFPFLCYSHHFTGWSRWNTVGNKLINCVSNRTGQIANNWILHCIFT